MRILRFWMVRLWWWIRCRDSRFSLVWISPWQGSRRVKRVIIDYVIRSLMCCMSRDSRGKSVIWWIWNWVWDAKSWKRYLSLFPVIWSWSMSLSLVHLKTLLQSSIMQSSGMKRVLSSNNWTQSIILMNAHLSGLNWRETTWKGSLIPSIVSSLEDIMVQTVIE